MRAAVATTTGVSSTTVASRLSTAVTTAARTTTRANSDRADRPDRRAVAAAAQMNSPSRSARWESSSTATRKPTVGAIERTAPSASGSPSAPTRTRNAAPGSATATGGTRGEAAVAATRVAIRTVADTPSARRSTTGSNPVEEVDRDRDAEGDDEDAQRRGRDAAGDAGAQEPADQAGGCRARHDDPVDRTEQTEDHDVDRRGDHRQRGLHRVGQLEPVQADAQDGEQDHAERAAEVAAVDRGEEQRHVQPRGVAAGNTRMLLA